MTFNTINNRVRHLGVYLDGVKGSGCYHVYDIATDDILTGDDPIMYSNLATCTLSEWVDLITEIVKDHRSKQIEDYETN